jgi:hypothetical protein
MTTQPIYLEEQMQSERLARAQSALASGLMSVQALDAATWRVDSSGTSPKGKQNQYTVSWDGQTWNCTCPDFSGRCHDYGLRCKHIEAVRYLEAQRRSVAGVAQPSSARSLARFSEERMALPATSARGAAVQPPPAVRPGIDPAPAVDLADRLRQPLDMNRVKRRQAPGQGTVPYLEGYSVIEIANDLFQFNWSFDLLGAPTVMRWERAVTYFDSHTRKKVPVLGEDGKPVTETAGLVYITGKISLEVDGKPVSHADVGRCVFSGDAPEALDMAIAGAATDCLKRCFRQMGERFGNSLYDKEVARTAGVETGSAPERPPARVNGKTVAPPPAAAETLQYRDGNAVEAGNAAETSAFNAFKAAHQGLAPATRETLRAWAKERS